MVAPPLLTAEFCGGSRPHVCPTLEDPFRVTTG